MVYSVGIDPGLGEAGIVLLEHRPHQAWVLEWALATDVHGKSFPTAVRAQGVAIRLVEHLQRWIDQHSIEHLAVGLEQPIFNMNAAAYAKQVATYQAIMAALMDRIRPMVTTLTVAEPIPSESKHLATGSGAASKAEVFKKSPFVNMTGPTCSLGEGSQQTLGDAWSHALAARGGCKTKWDAKVQPWPQPRPAGGIH